MLTSLSRMMSNLYSTEVGQTHQYIQYAQTTLSRYDTLKKKKLVQELDCTYILYINDNKIIRHNVHIYKYTQYHCKAWHLEVFFYFLKEVSYAHQRYF